MTNKQQPSENNTVADAGSFMQQLVEEHAHGMEFAAELMHIAEHGDDKEVQLALSRIQDYNEEELEHHFQHEEQAVLRPLVQHHPEYAPLCIKIGKEHGYLRSLVEELNPETARHDIVEFARVLQSHTVLENNELFPVIDDLFSDEQKAEITGFVPLAKQNSVQSPSDTGTAESPFDSEGRTDWLDDVKAFQDSAGSSGGSVVLFPRFMPELVSVMAEHLDLEYFDYQQEVMAAFGRDADSISLSQLDQSLWERSQQAGIVAHNVEALLCVKTEDERRQWLTAFLDTDWRSPVVLPISLYQGELPAGHSRVCDLELHKLPRLVDRVVPDTNYRSKYNID